ncbi:Protein SDA1-like protein [Hypsibius exemplaris]|uniref:Protein SDA1 n=1 Tax=Hypsibius exemplaris TaxID=2072580 RepID=A0A1W0WF02_HYPEX|nr:Protein SDA1-like protein [Hypsibius exemplaris]
MATRADKRFSGNLPQLQNLIKRDPLTYEAEYEQQMRQFESFVKIFASNPNEDHSHFDSLIIFLAHVSYCYPNKAKEFSEQMFEFLKTRYSDLSSGTRQALCKGLMLLHKRAIIDAEKLLPLFFEMLKSPDKHIRTLLSTQIVSMIKAINAKHKNQKTNSRIQNLFLDVVKQGHSVVSVVALEAVIHLYKKNIWRDQKAVNIVADACFTDLPKLVVLALRFFTSSDDSKKDNDDDDSDNEMKTAKELATAHRVGKKTNKRQKRMDRGLRQIKKNAKKQKKDPFDFSALHMIYDSQGFTEKLYKKLEKCSEQFETKLLYMDLLSRLIGIHKLLVLNFYPYVQRFLQPHQREVTKILLYAAQSAHEMVPPDASQALVKTIADNFIAERNSTEVIAVGMNSIREICARCPFAMTSDLIQDLAQYRKYRNKNVMSAAKSLVQLYRHIDPNMLRRRDRGRPAVGAEDLKLAEFGEVRAANYIEGAEVLPSDEDDVEDDADGWESASNASDDSGDGEWVDVPKSDDEAEGTTGYINPEVEALSPEAKKEKAAAVSSARFFSQKEFDIIRKKKIADIMGTNKGSKRSAVEAGLDKEPGQFVSLSDIERLSKRPKETRADKIAGSRVAREDRGAFGKPKPKMNPHASTTNKQKARGKNFMMIRQKVRGKQKRSFRDKQISFRNALVKQLKSK